MGQAYRVLRIEFESREELDREYESNLANGGLFLPGQRGLLYDEPVVVFVELLFADRIVELEGRVVQTIPIEFEANGGRCGVALEMSDSPAEIRTCLEEAIGEPLESDEGSDSSQRVARRSVAYAKARICVPGVSEIEGQTRNLSLAGVLVATSAEPPPVGQEVRVAIVHPKTGEERSIPGIVARHDVSSKGILRGVGIQFSVPPGSADATMEYLNRVKACEHARRLGGITGSIATLGVSDLILSFGQCVPAGRFILMKGGEIGSVFVASGMMVAAQVGAATGLKALVRMSAWQEGDFEFHANLAPDEEFTSMALPVETALLEAARLLDEDQKGPGPAVPRDAGLRIEHRVVDLEGSDLSKVEREILDRAGAGMTVARLLDTIQHPDGVIERAIVGLVERGALTVEIGA